MPSKRIQYKLTDIARTMGVKYKSLTNWYYRNEHLCPRPDDVVVFSRRNGTDYLVRTWTWPNAEKIIDIYNEKRTLFSPLTPEEGDEP